VPVGHDGAPRYHIRRVDILDSTPQLWKTSVAHVIQMVETLERTTDELRDMKAEGMSLEYIGVEAIAWAALIDCLKAAVKRMRNKLVSRFMEFLDYK